MPRRLLVAVTLLAAALLPAAPALAHQGNPNYRSIINSKPDVKGLEISIVNYDDSLSLTNTSGKTVTIGGYDGDSYLRFLPDGTVERNLNSPATYINNDREGTGVVPPNAKPGATPDWQVIDKSGRFIWHDHRIHYMGAGLPKAVTNTSVHTLVDNWKIPVAVDNAPTALAGHLEWVGRDDPGTPVGAIVGGAAILLLGGAAVLVVRRRRAGAEGLAGGPQAEAW